MDSPASPLQKRPPPTQMLSSGDCSWTEAGNALIREVKATCSPVPTNGHVRLRAQAPTPACTHTHLHPCIPRARLQARTSALHFTPCHFQHWSLSQGRPWLGYFHPLGDISGSRAPVEPLALGVKSELAACPGPSSCVGARELLGGWALPLLALPEGMVGSASRAQLLLHECSFQQQSPGAAWCSQVTASSRAAPSPWPALLPCTARS